MYVGVYNFPCNMGLYWAETISWLTENEVQLLKYSTV